MVRQENFERQDQYRETSLVDLARIVVRRRVVFYVTFGLIFFAGLFFALSSEAKFRYATIYSVGQPEQIGSKELLGRMTSALENTLIPEFMEAFLEKNQSKPPFLVSIETSKPESLVMLYSEASQAHRDLVKDAHERILQRLKEREEQFLSMARVTLDSRLEGVEALISHLQGVDDPGSAIAEAYASKTEIEMKLASEKKGEVVAIARKSLDKVSGSRALIGIMTVMFALVMGVLSTFVAEFVVKVRESTESGQEGVN